MRRAHLWLAGAVVVAGTAAIMGAGPSAGPAAEITGKSLAGAVATADDDVLGVLPSPTASVPAVVVEPAVDLERLVRTGDTYSYTLPDGRVATLTLVPELQELARSLLNESRAPRGGIVLMTPDGRILAMAGRRTTEPKGSRDGIFDSKLATEAWAPSASVFKLVTATALVQAGVNPDDKVCYHGGLRSVLEHNLRDDKRDSRCETLTYGVAHSQNAILGKLAFQHLEPAQLAMQATALGWSSPAPAAFGGTATGELVVAPQRDLEHARVAAGFAGAKLSVLGGALLAATFADAGEQPVPRLIAAIDGKPVIAPPRVRKIPEATARSVARMMAQTCTDGSAAKIFGNRKRISVAGKTGTLTRTDPFYMEHSWFVGFAPVAADGKPEVIVSALLGNPESWHLRGHEAAKRMVDRYVRVRDARDRAHVTPGTM